MTPLLESRAQRIAAIVVAVILIALGFLPLFGGPGYEHALASGLVVPTAAAIATALDVSKRRAPSLLACLVRGIASGAMLATVALATAIVHGLRVGICDFWGGVGTFGLTAGIGAVLGGAWGVVAGEIARGRRHVRLACVLLAIAAPIGCIAISVGRFFTSPMIFAFDPFVGYFSGTLYDTVIDAGDALLTYRAGSIATLVAFAFSATLVARDPELDTLRLTRPDTSERRARAAFAILAAFASLAITACGPSLGHWETSETIARELGGSLAGARCTVIFPSSQRADEAARLLKDCEEEVASVENALGTRGPDRITAFFFRDAAEKKRLMGAADTYIAKPWRHEVYLQVAAYPHPVLGHEIAHVVAGSFGHGPFRIAGSFGGYWPNPGLIEGTAVAASPDDDLLTDAEWARAMKDLAILPPVERVFSFGFLGDAASKSYTIAGAFVRFVIDRYGKATLRAWYAGGSIELLTKKNWAALDVEFRASLDAFVLPKDAADYAKAKFDRPSVFGRVCPHVVDRLRRDGDRCRDSNQYAKAIAFYEDALARDPREWRTRVSAATTKQRFGRDEAEIEAGTKDLVAIAADENAPRTSRDRSEEALADAAMLDGDFVGAGLKYRAIAARTLDEDAARTLEVKAIAASDPDARAAIVPLLIGARGRAPDPFAGALMMGEWEKKRASPVANYLAARNLEQHGWFDLARTHLEAILAGSEPTPRLARETIRQEAIVACITHDQPGRARIRTELASPSGPFAASASGRRDAILRLLDRCDR